MGWGLYMAYTRIEYLINMLVVFRRILNRSYKGINIIIFSITCRGF